MTHRLTVFCQAASKIEHFGLRTLVYCGGKKPWLVGHQPTVIKSLIPDDIWTANADGATIDACMGLAPSFRRFR